MSLLPMSQTKNSISSCAIFRKLNKKSEKITYYCQLMSDTLPLNEQIRRVNQTLEEIQHDTFSRAKWAGKELMMQYFEGNIDYWNGNKEITRVYDITPQEVNPFL